MRQIKLGFTPEYVSSLCLGCMYFGTKIDEDQSFRLIDQYLDAGGSFLDTANNYAFWVAGFEGGESERLLGRWLQARGNRDRVFLATKVGVNMPPRIPISLSRQMIIEQVEVSLRQLQTDQIDLLYAHTDDRQTPLEETLAAFDALVQQGKVRYIACSNTLAWRIQQARDISQHNGWAQYCVVQQRDSYLRPRAGVIKYSNGQVPITADLLDYATVNRDNFTIVAYSTLLGGVYADDETRIPENYQPEDYDRAETTAKMRVLREVAAETGATPNQVVLAWFVQNTPSMIALISSSSQARLQESLDADALTLTADQLQRLNAPLVG